MARNQLIQVRVTEAERKEFIKKAKKGGFKNMSDYLYWLVKNSLKTLAFLFLLTLIGCSSAGPFVTNISSDGRGGLNIEKQKVAYNWFLGVISTEEPSTQNIQLYQPSSPSSK